MHRQRVYVTVTASELEPEKKAKGSERTRTGIPRIIVLDMDFPRRMMEPQEHTRKNGDVILLIVDVCLRDVRVDIVSECLVADLFLFCSNVVQCHDSQKTC